MPNLMILSPKTESFNEFGTNFDRVLIETN